MTEHEMTLMKQVQHDEQHLLAKSKPALTTLYGRTCLGRISDPKGAGLSKAQMAYDICRARYGKRIAEAALL